MNWIEKVEQVFGLAACKVFNLDPTSKEANNFIRRAYRINPQGSTNAPTPANKNVMYIYVTHGTAPVRSYTQIDYKPKGTGKVWKDEYMRVVLTFYGNDADVFASRFVSMIEYNANYDSPYGILTSNNITPVFPLQEPISAPEIIDGQWRKRSDVQMTVAVWRCEDTTFNFISKESDIELSVGTIASDSSVQTDYDTLYPSVRIELKN